MGGSEFDPDEESRKPSEKQFFQQNLPGWEPIMTSNWAAITFIVFGIICLPLGIALLVASDELTEVVVPYGVECQMEGGMLCEDYFKENEGDNLGQICNCTTGFELTEDLEGEILMYYGIENFHQNHRYYFNSKDFWQLLGNERTSTRRPETNIEKKCLPLRWANTSEEFTEAFAPCGLIANSLFNDTFTLTFSETGVGANEDVGLIKRNIAWNSDQKELFRNPNKNSDETLQEVFNGTMKPPYWSKNIWELDTEDDDNNGYTNEDFIVWMRQSTFPNVRKLHRRIDHAGSFANGLPKGFYTLNVEYAFPTHLHEGEKKIIFANVSWAGGKNNFLGVLYIVCSVVFFALGVGFFFIWLYVRTWDKEIEKANKEAKAKGGDKGYNNPTFQADGSTEVQEDQPMTADLWRRRISVTPGNDVTNGKTSSPKPESNGTAGSHQNPWSRDDHQNSGMKDLEKHNVDDAVEYNAEGIMSVWM